MKRYANITSKYWVNINNYRKIYKYINIYIYLICSNNDDFYNNLDLLNNKYGKKVIIKAINLVNYERKDNLLKCLVDNIKSLEDYNVNLIFELKVLYINKVK